MMAVVTGLDADAGRATVEVPGTGLEFQVSEQAGWAPAVGDQVVLWHNGADLVSAPIPRHLLRGTMESGAGYDLFAENGWGFTDDGLLFANAAYIRGLIEAAEIIASTISGGEINGTTITGGDITGAIVTAALIRSAASGRRMEITDNGEIHWHSGAAGETEPGGIEMDGQAVRLRTARTTGHSQFGFLDLVNTGFQTALLAQLGHISLWARTTGGASGDMTLEADGTINLGAGGTVGLLQLNGRRILPTARGRFTGTTNANGDITIPHGLGVPCVMTAHPVVTGTAFGGATLVMSLAEATAAGNRFRCYFGSNASPSVAVTCDWSAVPA